MMHFFEFPLYIHALILGNCPFNRECAERALFKRFRDKLPDLGTTFKITEPIIYKSEMKFSDQQSNKRSIASGAGK